MCGYSTVQTEKDPALKLGRLVGLAQSYTDSPTPHYTLHTDVAKHFGKEASKVSHFIRMRTTYVHSLAK